MVIFGARARHEVFLPLPYTSFFVVFIREHTVSQDSHCFSVHTVSQRLSGCTLSLRKIDWVQHSRHHWAIAYRASRGSRQYLSLQFICMYFTETEVKAWIQHVRSLLQAHYALAYLQLRDLQLFCKLVDVFFVLVPVLVHEITNIR